MSLGTSAFPSVPVAPVTSTTATSITCPSGYKQYATVAYRRDSENRRHQVTAASTPNVDPRVARTRAAVLGAAIDLLAERGYSGFSVEGVVERTGIAKTTLYRHWPTRDDLLAAAIAGSTVPGSTVPGSTAQGWRVPGRSRTPARSAR